MSNRRFLKVKIKTLVSEISIIKKEEADFPGGHWLRGQLESHRKTKVARELRASLLAYGFLRGVPYSVIESNTKTPINYDRVREIVTKFNNHLKVSTQVTLQKFAEWQDSAKASVAISDVERENRRAAYFSSAEYAEHLRIKNLPEEEKRKLRVERRLASLLPKKD